MHLIPLCHLVSLLSKNYVSAAVLGLFLHIITVLFNLNVFHISQKHGRWLITCKGIKYIMYLCPTYYNIICVCSVYCLNLDPYSEWVD